MQEFKHWPYYRMLHVVVLNMYKLFAPHEAHERERGVEEKEREERKIENCMFKYHKVFIA